MYVADHTYFFYLHLETILLSLSSRELSVGLACMYCSYFDEVHEASKNRNLAIKTIPLDKKMKSRWRTPSWRSSAICGSLRSCIEEAAPTRCYCGRPAALLRWLLHHTDSSSLRLLAECLIDDRRQAGKMAAVLWEALCHLVGACAVCAGAYILISFKRWRFSELNELPGPAREFTLKRFVFGNTPEVSEEPFFAPHLRWWRESRDGPQTKLLHYTGMMGRHMVCVLDADGVKQVLTSKAAVDRCVRR